MRARTLHSPYVIRFPVPGSSPAGDKQSPSHVRMKFAFKRGVSQFAYGQCGSAFDRQIQVETAIGCSDAVSHEIAVDPYDGIAHFQRRHWRKCDLVDDKSIG